MDFPFSWEPLVAAGFGFVGGYAGIAGAPFIIFALVNFLNYSQHVAQGTVLAMMLGPMTILPVRHGWAIVCRRKREILTAILTYMGFSFLGGHLAYLLDSVEMRLAFGAFVTALGVVYIVVSLRHTAVPHSPHAAVPLIKMALIGAVIGTVGGVTGIGAGILLMPILTMGFGVEYHEAQTMSLAILLPPVSLGAVMKYGYMEGDINWPAAMAMLGAYVGTSALGYRFSFRHRSGVLRLVLAALLMAAGGMHLYGSGV